jgi:predicted ATPase
MKRYVITGGPCSGKSTVLELLAKNGHRVIDETARPLIEREKAKGSDVLPWINPHKFQRVVARIQFRKEFFAFIQFPDVIFLDRSLVDGCGYCVVEEVSVPWIIKRFGRKRYTKVFHLEMLPSYIYDTSRKEDRTLAIRIHEEIRNAYTVFGYEVISVPMMTPEERVEFILNSL